MTRDQITVGVMVRVIAARWDRPMGTIARATETGILFIDDRWWFTVEWLTYVPRGSIRSLRLFEEDLPTFELVTGPLVIPLPTTRRKQQQERRPLPRQVSLPFMRVEDDEQSHTLAPHPLGHLHLDV